MAEPSGGASGQASDIAIHAKEILRVREALTHIYQRHCGKEGESIKEGVQRFGEAYRYKLDCIVLTNSPALKREHWRGITS